LKYCINTSAIIDAAIRWHPPDSFPSFWTRLSELATSGQLISHEQVLLELEKKEGDVSHQWGSQRNDIFEAPTDATEFEMRRIMERFPQLAKGARGQHYADPFVIATARAHNVSVVTGEIATGNLERPHIPDVCSALSIPCISIVNLIREERWRF
jgi:hypothetical protein